MKGNQSKEKPNNKKTKSQKIMETVNNQNKWVGLFPIQVDRLYKIYSNTIVKDLEQQYITL